MCLTEWLFLPSHLDPIFQTHPEGIGHLVSKKALAQWSMTERAFEADLSVLRWVEELEQRVLLADLQIRVGTKARYQCNAALSFCVMLLIILEVSGSL